MTNERIDAVARTSYDPETGRAWGERTRRYPKLEIPAEWAPLTVSDISWTVRCRYYHNASCRALLAFYQMDVFVIHHPTEAGYCWELDRVETVLGKTEGIVPPRQLLTGHNWVLAHRRNRLEVDGYWL